MSPHDEGYHSKETETLEKESDRNPMSYEQLEKFTKELEGAQSPYRIVTIIGAYSVEKSGGRRVIDTGEQCGEVDVDRIIEDILKGAGKNIPLGAVQRAVWRIETAQGE